MNFTCISEPRKTTTSRGLFFWDTTPQQRVIASQNFEALQCAHLQGSKFRPLKKFTDISEKHAASILRVQESVNFYQITQQHVPKFFTVSTKTTSNLTLKHIPPKQVQWFASRNKRTDISPRVQFTLTHTMQRTHNKHTSQKNSVKIYLCPFTFK